jgi:hypothetical protein
MMFDSTASLAPMKFSAAVWSFTWDDSDDPKVAKWQSTDSNMTKKEAKAFGVTKIKELFERRKKLFM